ncbi:MAG: hypothetical protein HFF17_11380 [Oscillospiraceae bacterium]|nr:hypothetical protein [Oscillospiraceae bacterium]
MRKRAASLLIVIAVLLSLAGAAEAAAERASAYLERYTISLRAKGSGRMAIVMTVDGVDEMREIGVDEVFIEEKNSSTASWHEFDTYYGMDDPETYYDYNSYDYLRTVYFDGTPGRYYRVTIVAFAADKTGSDTGWVTSSTVLCK